jgi:hypothetical protein
VKYQASGGNIYMLLRNVGPAKTWDTVIDDAQERGAFTREERVESATWSTCAVGECVDSRAETYDAVARGDVRAIDAAFKRSIAFVNDHLSDPIHNLGCRFCEAVYTDNFDLARRVLASIREEYAVIIASGKERQ